jgi:pimeloyl-ACP methyl ester carboxylesterase
LAATTLAGTGLGVASAAPAVAEAAVAPLAATPPNVAAAPVVVAKTARGAVAYREVGHGSPLVLVMGSSGTMDDWAPSFVDALAAHHRVVIFDNAGVGDTGPVHPPLTITAMADQTSALITALGLGHPAVLGWSMGGMVAQALAVLHPSQVSRLILAATQAGTGKALPVPPAAAAAAASDNPKAVLSVLFPPGQVPVILRYVAEIASYPNFYVVPAAIKTAQYTAIKQWLAGYDPAGREETSLRLPTLVADGTVDALDPVANAHLLVQIIKGAQLALYPGAGHGFWFQDENQFVARADQFLG